MRTGKAAFILEQNTVKELKNAEQEAAKEVINTSDMAAQTPQNNSKVVNFDSLVDKDNEDNKDDLNEELSLDTAKLSPVTDEMLKEYEQKQDKVDEASYAADSIAVQVNETAASYSETTAVYSDSDSKDGKQMDDMDEEQSEKRLSGELAKIFRKYREMPGVGVTFAFLQVNIVPAITIIGCTTFVISIAGVYVGNVFGSRYKSRAELTGGIILILIGLKILLEHLGVIAF